MTDLEHAVESNRRAWDASAARLARGFAACVMLQLLYTYAPPLQALFGSVGLAPGEWARVLLAGLGLFCVAELEKWLCRRVRARQA